MSKNKKTSALAKEEEYQRINAELEAKTAALVKEADNLLNKTEHNFERPLLNNAILLDEDISDSKESHVMKIKDTSSEDTFQYDFRCKIAEIKENISNTNESNKCSKSETKPLENDCGIENEDIRYEVQNRYLKAKLRVLQEDNEKLAKEILKKQEDISVLQGRVKEVEDERNRLQKMSTSQMTQIEKSRKISEDYKSKNEILESQQAALKKELDQSKKMIEQQNSSNKSHEVRLNRVVEEATKYKNQLAQQKASQKDITDADRKKVDQLLSENRRLERQKAELIQAFRKQMQLIDVLKRQKMQIEMAKMLQFTEEEFIKALDMEK